MGEYPKIEGFTLQESLISILNTPIGKRKNSADVNLCVEKLATALAQGAKIIIPTR